MRIKHIKVALAAAAMLGGGQAFAAGTAANTDVNDIATVNYTVGGVAQNAVNSNLSTFKVDRKINVAVSEPGNSDSSAVPGAANQALVFDVANTGNDTQDYALTYTDFAGGAGPHGSTDNFDPTNVRFFADTNGNGSFDFGTDTQITFLDEVAPDTTRRVFVVADIPLAQVNGDLAAGFLTATTENGGSGGSEGSVTTQTAGADNATVVDNVFADAAGAAAGDVARDGKSSDDDAFKVSTATIVVNKYSRVLDDPFNGAVNPKRIPGATVEYCVAIRNTGASAATSVQVTDTISTDLNPAGSVVFNGTVANITTDTDATTCASIAGTAGGGSFTGQLFTSTAVASLPAGSTAAVRFTATIK